MTEITAAKRGNNGFPYIGSGTRSAFTVHIMPLERLERRNCLILAIPWYRTAHRPSYIAWLAARLLRVICRFDTKSSLTNATDHTTASLPFLSLKKT